MGTFGSFRCRSELDRALCSSRFLEEGRPGGRHGADLGRYGDRSGERAGQDFRSVRPPCGECGDASTADRAARIGRGGFLVEGNGDSLRDENCPWRNAATPAQPQICRGGPGSRSQFLFSRARGEAQPASTCRTSSSFCRWPKGLTTKRGCFTCAAGNTSQWFRDKIKDPLLGDDAGRDRNTNPQCGGQKASRGDQGPDRETLHAARRTGNTRDGGARRKKSS